MNSSLYYRHFLLRIRQINCPRYSLRRRIPDPLLTMWNELHEQYFHMAFCLQVSISQFHSPRNLHDRGVVCPPLNGAKGRGHERAALPSRRQVEMIFPSVITSAGRRSKKPNVFAIARSLSELIFVFRHCLAPIIELARGATFASGGCDFWCKWFVNRECRSVPCCPRGAAELRSVASVTGLATGNIVAVRLRNRIAVGELIIKTVMCPQY